MTRFFRLFALVISCTKILFGVPFAFAVVSEWVPLGAEDIRVIENPKLEFQLRLHMIREAKHKIDIVTFEQAGDEILGMPIIDALEEAALKGVQVRLALDWLPMPLNDFFGRLHARILGIAERSENFQFTYMGKCGPHSRNWKFVDGIHEKLMIIDDQWALTTGRGHAEKYLRWLDTGFVFKGALVHETQVTFDRLWAAILRENHESKPGPASPPTLAPDLKSIGVPEGSIQITLYPRELEEWNSLSEWLTHPPSQESTYRARVLHHDFLDQMRNLSEAHPSLKKPSDSTLDQRIELLVDPVVEAMTDQLKTAKKMNLTLFSASLHPKLKQAILKRLEDGSESKNPFQLNLFTNTRKSHLRAFPIPPAVGWYLGLPDLDDLLHSHENAVGYLISSPQRESDPIYTHRKLVIFEQDAVQSGRESSVIFGSHNMTFGSTTTLDEVSFQIESNEFAAKMNDIFYDSIHNHAHVASKPSIKRQRLTHTFVEWFSRFFTWLY